jgi:hypothetical protein
MGGAVLETGEVAYNRLGTDELLLGIMYPFKIVQDRMFEEKRGIEVFHVGVYLTEGTLEGVPHLKEAVLHIAFIFFEDDSRHGVTDKKAHHGKGSEYKKDEKEEQPGKHLSPKRFSDPFQQPAHSTPPSRSGVMQKSDPSP